MPKWKCLSRRKNRPYTCRCLQKNGAFLRVKKEAVFAKVFAKMTPRPASAPVANKENVFARPESAVKMMKSEEPGEGNCQTEIRLKNWGIRKTACPQKP